MDVEFDDGPDLDQPVSEALEALQKAIASRVSAEQGRCQLTGLPNGLARDNWLRDAVEDAAGTPERGFWIAFIEVDQFKSVNDKHGYESADLFLKYVARELRRASRGIAAGATSFRPHGDEFYLAGPLGESDADDNSAPVATALENLRVAVESLEVPCEQTGGRVRATVSIGWTVSDDITEELVPRTVLTALERAMQRAKERRNCVVRFEEQMRKATTVDARSDCKQCATKFSLIVKLDERRSDQLYCPNCGQPVKRPLSLAPQAVPDV